MRSMFITCLLVFLITQVKSIFVYYQNYEYLSTIKLNDYSGYYGNVKLLRYSIPMDVLSAIWRLQLVATDSCPPTDVYFYLEYSGYPVISPNNRTFPPNFNPGRLTKTFVKRQLGGGVTLSKQNVYLNISSPLPGYWFSAAFVDQNDQKVKPDLLKANCSFFLTASVDLWQMNDTIVMYPNRTLTSIEHTMFKIYKYFSISFDGPLLFNMSFNAENTTKQCRMTALLRQSAFPDMNIFSNNNGFLQCDHNSTNCQLNISYPMTNTWYYLALASDCAYDVTVLTLNDCQSETKQQLAILNQTLGNVYLLNDPAKISQYCSKLTGPIETFRFIGSTFFSVKYYFNSNYNRSNALLVRNDRKPYFIEFLVDLANNGGTLSIYIVNNLIYDPSFDIQASKFSMPASTSTKSANETHNSTVIDKENIEQQMRQFNQYRSGSMSYESMSLSDVKVMLYACLLFNSMSTYDKCPEGYLVSVQSYTNIFSNIQMNIPYPMMGKWYLAIWKECFNINTNESIPCPSSYVPHSMVQIVSDQCANDYCGDYGTCYIINSQLNLVSACKCSGGYEGYGCTDGTNAIPARIYLASVLFLTLSNMVFIIPIGVAIYRQWYIEALIYFFNMFFSTFYHACDQDFYSFCIFNYDGLQLADFIGSYSSFVVTLLAMSAFARPWKVFTFFVGVLACLSINLYDRFNYVAFVIFVCIAISVTVATWVRVCVRTRKLHPKKSTIFKFYLPGVILAASGLVIYSFLQTKSNYWVLHSIWHICMASSIVFFLPKRDKQLSELIIASSSSSSSSTGDNLKDVTNTTSSLSESSGSTSNSPAQSPQPQSTLHTNHTEITLLEAVEQ